MPDTQSLTAGFAFPCVVRFDVDWPLTVWHDGLTYRKTGKVGTNMKTQLPAAEYAFRGSPYPECVPVEARLWILADGTIEPD